MDTSTSATHGRREKTRNFWHVDTIVLVLGDSDFVPAMKFARREGAQLYLVPLGHGVRYEMLEHSDLVLEIATEREPFRRKKEAHAA